jgi:Zn ribbon nucleic-acid-binding protein
MSKLTALEIPREANRPSESKVPTNQSAKVLSMTECPSCFRKGTMELFIQKHGEYTYCYACGHRETSFYR